MGDQRLFMAPVAETGAHGYFLERRWKAAGRCIQELGMERVSKKLQEEAALEPGNVGIKNLEKSNTPSFIQSLRREGTGLCIWGNLHSQVSLRSVRIQG